MSPMTTANLEDVLQCPVCFEVPPGPILLCEQGHGVCQSCWRKLTNCPVCRGMFYGTRNFMVEELIDRMKRVNTNETSSANPCPNITRRAAPGACPGFFQCKVPDCTENKLPACRMLNHIRYRHQEILLESMTQDGLTFTRVMDILWIPSMRQVFAMQVSDMGLFFLVIDNDRNGNLRAWLQMVASQSVAGTFLYELNFHSADMYAKSVFIDKVRSVNLPETRFFSTRASPVCTMIDERSNIFNLIEDCPKSKLHIAITFSNTYRPVIIPSAGTRIYKDCQRGYFPELKRPWSFESSDENDSLQGAVGGSSQSATLATSCNTIDSDTNNAPESSTMRGYNPYGTDYNHYGTGNYPYASGFYPYGASNYPYGTSNHPYGAAYHPYGAANHPYTGYNRDGAANHPYTGYNRDYTGYNDNMAPDTYSPYSNASARSTENIDPSGMLLNPNPLTGNDNGTWTYGRRNHRNRNPMN